jgi:hypothetical protein
MSKYESRRIGTLLGMLTAICLTGCGADNASTGSQGNGKPSSAPISGLTYRGETSGYTAEGSAE